MLWKYLVFTAIVSCQLLLGDSGGPYQMVPDTKARSLSFYVSHLPELRFSPEDRQPSAIKWKKREPHDSHISIERIENFPGRLCAVSYIPMEHLKRGTLRKSGVMILAPAENELYTAVHFQTSGTPSVVETYSIKVQKLLKEEPFLSVTCHYSGTGQHRSTQYFRWKDFKLSPHGIWAKNPDFSGEIEKAGWKNWHRGHWNDPAKKASYKTVYRKPEEANGGRSGHATIEIKYKWVDEKLTAQRWEILPEEWRWIE